MEVSPGKEAYYDGVLCTVLLQRSSLYTAN